MHNTVSSITFQDLSDTLSGDKLLLIDDKGSNRQTSAENLLKSSAKAVELSWRLIIHDHNITDPGTLTLIQSSASR